MKITKQTLYQLKSDRAEALTAAETAMDKGLMEDYEAEMDRVKDFNGQIDKVEKLLEERERFHTPEPPALTPEPEPAGKGYEAAVKAFAAAARAGFYDARLLLAEREDRFSKMPPL